MVNIDQKKYHLYNELETNLGYWDNNNFTANDLGTDVYRSKAMMELKRLNNKRSSRYFLIDYTKASGLRAAEGVTKLNPKWTVEDEEMLFLFEVNDCVMRNTRKQNNIETFLARTTQFPNSHMGNSVRIVLKYNWKVVGEINSYAWKDKNTLV